MSKLTLEIPVKELTLSFDSDLLNFGTSGALIERTVTEKNEKNVSVSFNHPLTYTYDIYVKDGYIPDEVSTQVFVNGMIKDSSGEQTDCDQAAITIGNLDLQKNKAKEQRTGLSYGQQLSDASAKLNACTAIALDANISNYFTSEQQREIEKFLTIYLSEMITADEYEKSDRFTRMTQKAKKDIKKKLLGKLGVNVKTMLFARSICFNVDVRGTSISGSDVTIEFSGVINDYSIGEANPYGAYVEIYYKVKDKKDVPEGASREGTGMATFADLESFANSMLDFLEISYNDAWGKRADQIVSMIISEPVNDLLFDGSFSGKVFQFSKDQAKECSKKVSVHCPVDVYVYDYNGNLCGQIVDNHVDNSTQDIVLSTNGDEKYIYTAGGDYSIKLVGNDSGTMNYTVAEYNGTDIARTVETYNVPLKNGTVYETLVNDMPFADEDVYALYNENDQKISLDSDTYDDTKRNEVELYVGNIFDEGDYTCTVLSDYTVSISDYKNYDAVSVTIPKVIVYGGISYKVTRIGNYAFDGFWCDGNLTSITVPNSVTSIGERAFFNCNSLTSVTIPNSVTSIGAGAFEGCESLASVAIPNSVTSLGDRAFSCCNSLISVTIPNSVTSIGDSAFYGCNSLTGIKIPNSVTSIGDSAFYSCDSLTSVMIPKSVTSIGDGAFEYCDNLTSVTIPNSVTSIGREAFSYCDGLTSVTIPNSVTSIGDSAFYSCHNLTSVIIPNSVTSIGNYMFSWCYSLASVTIPNGVTSIGNHTFHPCPGLTSVTLPNSVTSFGDYAFEPGDDNLTISGYTGSAAEQYAKNNWISFNALDKQVSISTCTATLSSTTYTYDGKEKKPAVTVKDGNATLKNGTDYTVAYKNNINAGTATVTINGKGKYTGSVSKTFKINKVNQTLTATCSTASVIVGKTATITAKGTGTITYASSNTAVATVSAKGVVTAKAPGTVTITVKAAGNGNYNAATKTVKITVSCATPSLKKIENVNGGVKLTWGKVAGAAKYRVFYKNTKGKWIKLGDTTKTSYTWKKVKPGTKYTFTVRCISKDGKNYTSNFDKKGKTVQYIAAPVLSKVQNTKAGVKVTWKKSAGAAKYRVFRKTGNGKWVKVGDTTKLTFVDKKAKKGVKYTYTVRCISKNGKNNTSAYNTKGLSIKRK